MSNAEQAGTEARCYLLKIKKRAADKRALVNTRARLNASPVKTETELDCSRLTNHHGHANNRQRTAADHVHDMLGLARAAIHGVGHLCTRGGRRARDRILAVKTLNKEEHAERDKNDADYIFHRDMEYVKDRPAYEACVPRGRGTIAVQ